MAKIFLKGLAAILPLAITLALLIWFFSLIEGTMGFLVKHLIGAKNYFPGLGLLVGLILVFILGFFLNAWIVQKIYKGIDLLFKKIPVVKALYGSVKELLKFFSSPKGKSNSNVVMITIQGMKLIGLVTRENFDDLPGQVGGKDDIAVYIPMSYQLGGFTVIVPRSTVQPVPEMTTERGLRFVVTAGMQATKGEENELIEKLPGKNL
jgi:uncharacterized membrane protein